MKASNRTLRAVAALVLTALTALSIRVGIPALAAEAEAVSVIAQNSSPIAQNLEYTTFRGVEVKGQMAATDPDGDAVTFKVTDIPKKGALEAKDDGSFIYTPHSGRKGEDSFSYVAVDVHGNISAKATVTITINKKAAKITYSDMHGNGSHYAALVLSERGVLTGEKLGTEYFFRPDEPVSRSEFLAMCLALSDTETLEGITRTGFYDDATIPVWAKPYVSTALMSGIITGYKNLDGRLVFDAQDAISFSEAAVILDNILGITDVVDASAIVYDACPAWSQQAEANLAACNILPAAARISCETSMTRADAADMLAASVSLIDARGSRTSLLSWAK